MQKVIGYASFLAATQAADWNYLENGADWPNLAIDDNLCGETNQSPIDLLTDYSSYPNYSAADDDLSKIYSNQKGMTVNWNGHTSQVGSHTVVEDNLLGTNVFRSKLGASVFATTTTFEGK